MMFRMKRKYGPDLADVLETAQRVRSELSDLDESDHDIIVLSQRMDTAGAELKSAAGALSSKRRDAAARLGAAIASTLPALGLPGAVFDVALRAHGEVGAGGAEGVEFLVSPNPGFEPQPLARIGSGGELSRVMLALKSTLADVDRVPVLVFDEIDAGIGGVVASAVALKLAEVAERHQVFVVTHLAQVASRANTHLLVEKEQGANGTVTSVRPLTADARVEEIARMLGGDPESPTSRQHARELLRLT
jgi:DNA repair protein RecN (Recombination protein N)